MLEIPFALQWTIPENRLTPLKNSIRNERLFSTTISNIPDFEYFLGIYPNGACNEIRGKTQIFLYLKPKNVKKVDAKWKISIESANGFSISLEHIFEKHFNWGAPVFFTKDFFDSKKKYIVDGKCTIKVNGTFKFEKQITAMTKIGEQQKWEGIEFGDQLWANEDRKDFTIIVDGKEIKVHELVLVTQSSVFSAMLNTNTKESIEKKVEILDFSFNVVETAIKLIYNCNFVSSLSFVDQMFLLQFFDKYDLPTLKDKVEQILITQISESTVCRLTNCSIFTNSENLKNYCINVLKAFLASEISIIDIEILNKEIDLKALQNSLCQIVEIDNS